MQHQREGRALEVRVYRPGDEGRIVKFLDEQMGWPAASVGGSILDHWKWKYLSHPLGINMVCLAECDNEIISHCASLPVKMSVGGKEVLASQGVDLCTHPQYRGRGLMGMTMQIRDLLKENHKVALDFGLPNPASYHVSTVKRGFQELGLNMLQHQFIIDPEEFFRKVRFGPLKRLGYASLVTIRRSMLKDVGDLDVESQEHFTERDSTLYERESRNFDIIASRSSDQLNWRYCDPRAGAFLRRGVREGGRLLGYSVLKEEVRDGTKYLNIVDLLVEKERNDVLIALLLDALEEANKQGAESAICCLPEGHPYGRSLQEPGFHRPAAHDPEICPCAWCGTTAAWPT